MSIAIECKDVNQRPVEVDFILERSTWTPYFRYKSQNRTFVIYFEKQSGDAFTGRMYRAERVGNHLEEFVLYNPPKTKLFDGYYRAKGDCELLRRTLSGFKNVAKDGLAQLWRDCNTIKEFEIESTIPVWTNGLTWLVFPVKEFAGGFPTYEMKTLLEGSGSMKSFVRVDFSKGDVKRNLERLRSILNGANS